MLVITLPLVDWGGRTRVRCVDCAGQAPPVDLPPLPVRAGIDPTVKASAARQRPLFASVGSIAADWKARSAGEREPGEDDQ